jgi:hypothetical protein
MATGGGREGSGRRVFENREANTFSFLRQQYSMHPGASCMYLFVTYSII